MTLDLDRKVSNSFVIMLTFFLYPVLSLLTNVLFVDTKRCFDLSSQIEKERMIGDVKHLCFLIVLKSLSQL